MGPNDTRKAFASFLRRKPQWGLLWLLGEWTGWDGTGQDGTVRTVPLVRVTVCPSSTESQQRNRMRREGKDWVDRQTPAHATGHTQDTRQDSEGAAGPTWTTAPLRLVPRPPLNVVPGFTEAAQNPSPEKKKKTAFQKIPNNKATANGATLSYGPRKRQWRQPKTQTDTPRRHVPGSRSPGWWWGCWHGYSLQGGSHLRSFLWPAWW